jgi:hypothetical protein
MLAYVSTGNGCFHFDRLRLSERRKQPMKYEIDIPEHVDHALLEQATAAGKNVVELIQHVIVSFAYDEASLARARRRPDFPLEPAEISAPCDLPRSVATPVTIDRISKRRPDPIAQTL